jgi:hypothetical protein
MSNQGSFTIPGNAPSRGLGNHSGGAFDQSMMQDIVDSDSLQGQVTQLFGTTAGSNPDVLNPAGGGNYVISSGAVDGITLALPKVGGPSVGGQDGVTINIYSDTAFAHTVTLPSAGYAIGSAAPKTVATFTAQRGAGMTLRAWNGTWQVLSQSANTAGALSVTFT